MTIKQEIALIQRQTAQVRAVRETIENLPPIGEPKPTESISVRAFVSGGGFRIANASQLHVGVRVRVASGTISRLGGQSGRIVRRIGRGLYVVRSDSGLVGKVARWDIALESK